MKIAQLLMKKRTWDIKRATPDMSIRQIAETLLEHKIGALVVCDRANRMVGIVSERDLIGIVASRDPNAGEAPVREIMTQEVISCGPKDEVAFVLRSMNDNAIRHMPVIEKGELVGLLSMRELTTAYEALKLEANTDPLTKVSNRRPFLATLETEFERARRHGGPLSVAMLDIDHFKTVNDTHGHAAGDRALRAMSRLLISEFRSIDLVGRLGGEEFALVFPETDLAGANVACQRLLENIRDVAITDDDVTFQITVSIGIAQASEEMPDGACLLKSADDMLYVAKRTGRNRIVSQDETAASEQATA